MKISVIHPTRNRFDLALKTQQNWFLKATDPNSIEFITSVDYDDSYPYEGSFLGVLRNYNSSAIDAINNAAKVATGDIFVVISDDFDCPEKWDILLLDIFKEQHDFVLKTMDGLQKTLVTLPIMDRTYYNRFGYIYYPGYVHLFSDQEMTAVAHMIGKIVESNAVFKHNHYSTDNGIKKDAISIKNDRTWRQGELLFKKRLKENFNLKSDQIKKQYIDIIWH